jgi:hypothetical protein
MLCRQILCLFSKIFYFLKNYPFSNSNMSFATSTSTTASTTFIDLATFSELEGFLYGGPNAITWFVASVQKGNWFSYIPIVLRNIAGAPDFGQQNVAASVNRSGDYVLATWFRAQIPKVGFNGTDGFNANSSIRWTRNLMHNLISRCQISFNELVVQEFDNYWLDFNYQFRLRGSKRIGYRNMIGDIAAMTNPVGPGVPLGTGGFFSCPLPFWFSEDSGLALPVAALPFNDIKIIYNFRSWQHLLVINPGTGGTPPNINDVIVFNSSNQPTTNQPSLVDPNTFAHYVVVHNDERVKMGDAPRDMLIHQVQESQLQPFKDVTSRSTFDIRLSHAIVLFCFSAENNSWFNFNSGTYGREMSNYTTLYDYLGSDPLQFSTLLYENTPRLAMGVDYYSLISPYYFSTAIPEETGYHMWTYSIRPWSATKPAGSTNYSKLANVSILQDCSLSAINSANTTNPTDDNGDTIYWPPGFGNTGTVFPQTFQHVFVSKNYNIARESIHAGKSENWVCENPKEILCY